MKKNNVLAMVIAVGFLTLLIAGCNKYDKMSIVGTWEIDLKAAQNLAVDSSREVLFFNSGSAQTYNQTYFERNNSLTSWSISGNFERKHNKITFTNRIQNGTAPQGDITYKYRIENDKLIFIAPNEGFTKDEKVYTKKK